MKGDGCGGLVRVGEVCGYLGGGFRMDTLCFVLLLWSNSIFLLRFLWLRE